MSTRFALNNDYALQGARARWGFRLDIERFWEKVDTTSKSCWEWQANRTSQNYGRFNLTSSQKPVLAHRFAWEDVIGPIPKGVHVCHKCDNPPCVNPDHLFLGTDLDNQRDSFGKGRRQEQKERFNIWVQSHRTELSAKAKRQKRGWHGQYNGGFKN